MTELAGRAELSRRMSLREQIAQLVFVRIGSNMPPVRTVEQDAERIARLLETCPVGGLELFNGRPETKETLERLQAISRVPLLVGSDIERGVGQQVRGYPLYPHARAFDALGSDAAAAVAEFARSIANDARDVGIHIAFAPVADVNTNPRNPIINTRAYSENIARAVELTRAYVVAAETAGLRTTAKHFPGHGSTEKDSHDSLPSVPRTRAELEACELVPFRAAIDAGCSMVMTAHVSYPTLDPSGAPATLSPKILQQLLRDEMGFGGVICSDSLLMAGARDLFAREEEMALAVLNAGVDMLLDFIEPARVIDYLCDCVEVGKLDVQRVEEAAWRVRALKERVFGNVRKDGNGRVMHNSVSRPSLAERVAAGAVDVVDRRDSGLLPFHPDAPLVAILLKPFETPIEPPEQPLGAAIRERFRNAKYVQLGPNADADSYQATYDLARGARQLLIAVIVRPAAWYAFGLRKEQVEFVRQLTGERHDVVLASLGVKFVLEDYPGAGVRICTYSDVPVSQQALAEFLVKSGGTP